MVTVDQRYVYDFTGIEDQTGSSQLQVWYVISQDKLAVNRLVKFNGTEYDGTSSTAYIDGPFANPAGTLEYFQSDWWESGGSWESVDLEPFIVPSKMDTSLYSGINSDNRNAMFYGGWVSFEKSFGFSSALSEIEIWVIDDGVEKKITTISKNTGIYLPDIFTAKGTDAYGFVRANDAAPLLEMYYPGTLLQSIISPQTIPLDLQQIMPVITQHYVGQLFGDINNQVVVESQIKNPVYTWLPKTTWYIDNAIATGARKILLPDGSVRVLVANLTNNKFDLYNVSNGGVTVMFEDLWGETYHGAQLAYLLDGTLVSYAWKINYTAPTEEADAAITYALYFKRSSNNGATWESAILAKDGIGDIGGIPILTQDIKTGKISIGLVYSDDMGLTWYENV